MSLFDIQIDFFRPRWRRILTVAFCLVWAGVEFANGALFWGFLFGAMGVYALHQFFFDNWPS